MNTPIWFEDTFKSHRRPRMTSDRTYYMLQMQVLVPFYSDVSFPNLAKYIFAMVLDTVLGMAMVIILIMVMVTALDRSVLALFSD